MNGVEDQESCGKKNVDRTQLDQEDKKEYSKQITCKLMRKVLEETDDLTSNCRYAQRHRDDKKRQGVSNGEKAMIRGRSAKIGDFIISSNRSCTLSLVRAFVTLGRPRLAATIQRSQKTGKERQIAGAMALTEQAGPV